MKISKQEKHNFIDAISQEVFRKPLKHLKWENLNTLTCSIIARGRGGEIDEPTQHTMVQYILSIRDNYPRIKTHYEWND